MGLPVNHNQKKKGGGSLVCGNQEVLGGGSEESEVSRRSVKNGGGGQKFLLFLGAYLVRAYTTDYARGSPLQSSQANTERHPSVN